MATATNEEITQAVDALRALTCTEQHLPDRGAARQLLRQLSEALALEENEMVLRLAAYSQRNEQHLTDRLLAGIK